MPGGDPEDAGALPGILLSKHGRLGRFHPNPKRRRCRDGVRRAPTIPLLGMEFVPGPWDVSPTGTGDRRMTSQVYAPLQGGAMDA